MAVNIEANKIGSIVGD